MSNLIPETDFTCVASAAAVPANRLIDLLASTVPGVYNGQLAGAATVASAVSTTGQNTVGGTFSAMCLNGTSWAYIEAHAAITAGALVYADAAGRVGPTAGNRRIGRALNAATNQGDLLLVQLSPA